MSIEKMQKLYELKGKGIITQAEFDVLMQDKPIKTSAEFEDSYVHRSKTIKSYIFECLTIKYACFKGRASRKEYWSLWLFSQLISLLLGLVLFWGSLVAFEFLSDLVSILLIVPFLAVSVRRLHDVNMSGWWVLTLIVPLVVSFMKGTEGPNKYDSI